MATKKKSKVSKAAAKRKADKVLKETLVKLTADHVKLLPLDESEAANVVSRSKPYPVYKGAGKPTEWFRQCAVSSSHTHTAAVEPVKRPRDAARLLRLANEAFNKERKAKSLARQYDALKSVPTVSAMSKPELLSSLVKSHEELTGEKLTTAEMAVAVGVRV